MNGPLPSHDIELVLEAAENDLRDLGGARVFVTGGTGFVGTWLLETYCAAWDAFGLRGELTVLTRDPVAFAHRVPHIANHQCIRLARDDVRNPLPAIGTFDAIVHGATPASARVNDETPELMVDTVVGGMQTVLEIAQRSGPIPFLLTSSGAVYGRQPSDLSHVGEDYPGGPDPLDARNAYHEAKRLAELLGTIAHEQHGVAVKIARLFAFVGPRLPIDRHFAIGNFIADVLEQRPVVVQGDGRPVRSYLYAADMTTWLWRILVRAPACRAYNVGSEHAVTIADTARAVAAAAGTSAVEIRQQPDGSIAHRYVPSTARARSELGLQETVTLAEALKRTLAWHRAGLVTHTEAAP